MLTLKKPKSTRKYHKANDTSSLTEDDSASLLVSSDGLFHSWFIVHM